MDPISLQKVRVKRKEGRTKRAQWEEQINPDQTIRNHERREDHRQYTIDRQNKAKRQREIEIERQRQFEEWKTNILDSYYTGIQTGIPQPPNNMTKPQQIEADEMLARALYEQEKATVALADKKTNNYTEELKKQRDLRQAIDNTERTRIAK